LVGLLTTVTAGSRPAERKRGSTLSTSTSLPSASSSTTALSLSLSESSAQPSSSSSSSSPSSSSPVEDGAAVRVRGPGPVRPSTTVVAPGMLASSPAALSRACTRRARRDWRQAEEEPGGEARGRESGRGSQHLPSGSGQVRRSKGSLRAAPRSKQRALCAPRRARLGWAGPLCAAQALTAIKLPRPSCGSRPSPPLSHDSPGHNYTSLIHPIRSICSSRSNCSGNHFEDFADNSVRHTNQSLTLEYIRTPRWAWRRVAI
ncbi:Protein of unknown function, partial [Gryllus bimaculatus]